MTSENRHLETPADPAPFVLTLVFAPEAQDWLQGLRDRHFPPERNIVPAHVCLFHALPPESEAEIVRQLADEVAALPGQPGRRMATIGPPLRLGRGVALAVDAPWLHTLQKRLASRWRDWLTPQDRQRFRPHATLQNKVTPEEARALFDALSATLPPREAPAAGAILWRYRAGPWEEALRVAL